jgi:AAA domain
MASGDVTPGNTGKRVVGYALVNLADVRAERSDQDWRYADAYAEDLARALDACRTGVCCYCDGRGQHAADCPVLLYPEYADYLPFRTEPIKYREDGTVDDPDALTYAEWQEARARWREAWEAPPPPPPPYLPGWAVQDFLSHAATPPEPPSVGTATWLYPGQRHALVAEPGHAKTWLALVEAVEVMKAGGVVVWVNTDNAPEAQLRERLNLLGADDGMIRGLFRYVRPNRKALVPDDRTQLPEIVGLAREHEPVLAVMDSFNPTLALQRLNYMDETEVDEGWRTLATPFTDVGAAFLVLDHLAKSTESRGRFAIGSQRKLAGCDVHVGMKLKQPFGRGQNGRAYLVTQKDRNGYLVEGKAFGDFTINAETSLFSAGIEPHDDSPFRPTVLMERVSDFVLREGPCSQNAIQQGVQGNRESIILALETLIAEGYIERKQTGQKRVHTHARAYSERDESGEW